MKRLSLMGVGLDPEIATCSDCQRHPPASIWTSDVSSFFSETASGSIEEMASFGRVEEGLDKMAAVDPWHLDYC